MKREDMQFALRLSILAANARAARRSIPFRKGRRREFGRPPQKGSALRAYAVALLSGCSCEDGQRIMGNYARASRARTVLLDEKGYDVRRFPDGRYQIIGKMLPGCRYRSFLKEQET